jgi:MFS family permease
MRAGLGLSDSQIAMLQGPALILPAALLAIPLGHIVDRHSRTRLLVVALALTAVGSGLTAVVSSPVALFIARAIVGISGFATGPIIFSLLADLYAPSERGRAASVVALGQVAGGASAFALGGALVGMFDGGPDGWRSAMLWMAAALVAAPLLMLTLREPAHGSSGGDKQPILESLTQLLRHRAVIGSLLGGVVIVQIAEGAVSIWAAPTLSRGFALPPEHVGATIAAVLLVSGVLGPLTGGALADACQRLGGPRRTMSVLSGLAFLTAAASLFPLMPGATSAIAALAAFATIGFAINVMGAVLFINVIDAHLRGVGMSVLTAAGLLPAAMAPVVVSALTDALGGPQMLGKSLAWVCFMSCLAGAMAFAVGKRYVGRKNLAPAL